MKVDLSLAESLCGFKIPVETLDKRTIAISSPQGQVVPHGAMRMVEEEGFPRHRDPFNKGRLIVVFSVQFPESLTADAAKKVRQALSKTPTGLPERRPASDAAQDAEDVEMKEFDGKGEWKGGETERPESAYDDDGDDEGMRGAGGGPQCAQQ